MIDNKIPDAIKTSFISFKSFIFLSQKLQKYYTYLLNFDNPFLEKISFDKKKKSKKGIDLCTPLLINLFFPIFTYSQHI